MALIDEILPSIERLGVVYDPGLDNSVAYVDLLQANAASFRWAIVGAVARPATRWSVRSLVGRADALYSRNGSADAAVLLEADFLPELGRG